MSYNHSIVIKINGTVNGIPIDILNKWGKPFNFKDKSKGSGLVQWLIFSISQKLGFKHFKHEKNPYSASGTLIKILIPIDSYKSSRNYNYPLTLINKSGILIIF